jgi:prenyltransferase beta subunit
LGWKGAPIKAIGEGVLAFVMARRQESGGFGFAPTVPASVEDTYYALRILDTVLPGSEQFTEIARDPILKAYLTRAEGKETWSPRTAYQYLFLCGLCGSKPDQGWLERFMVERLKGTLSLRDRYYFLKILKECGDAPLMGRDALVKEGEANRWRTARDLWMCFYLHGGSPEALQTTREAITKWAQECQNPDGGFGFLPGTTSFVENGHYCLRVLSSLEENPLSLDKARDFILRGKTSGGGFARKNGAAPFLDSTWHAVASLSLLRITFLGKSGLSLQRKETL